MKLNKIMYLSLIFSISFIAKAMEPILSVGEEEKKIFSIEQQSNVDVNDLFNDVQTKPLFESELYDYFFNENRYFENSVLPELGSSNLDKEEISQNLESGFDMFDSFGSSDLFGVPENMNVNEEAIEQVNNDQPEEIKEVQNNKKRKLIAAAIVESKKQKKEYACDECGKSFSHKSHFKDHQRIHSGEKPFECDECDYKCNKKNDLTKHKKKHSGEKPFACDLCDYKCSQKGSLIIHKRRHTGEKSYACDKCDYKSSRKENLITHQRTHTGEKPFACNLCDYKGSQKAHLIVHKRNIHKVEE